MMNSISGNITRNTIFLLLLSGTLSALAFPSSLFPDGQLSWLAWCGLVPFLFAIRDLPPTKSFKSGLIFGLCHFTLVVYWVVHAMNLYGNLHMILCIPALLIFSTYLSLYFAAFGWLISQFCSRPTALLLFGGFFGVVLEWIRSWMLSGFPWELFGYSQFNRIWLIQIADVLSVFGISFLIFYTNLAIFLFLLGLTRLTWQHVTISKRLMTYSVVSVLAILCIVLAYGKFRADTIDHMIARAPKKKIAVIQGNVPQSQKWEPSFQFETIRKYNRLSLSTRSSSPHLIIWPETATPFHFQSNSVFTKQVVKTIQKMRTHYLIGSPSHSESSEKTIRYYNSAYLLNPNGQIIDRYDKVHLVPFGEFVPLNKILFFINKMVEGIGDFSPGKKGNTLKMGDIRLGIQVCYEIIFPHLVREMVKNDAAIIINITNDAWFGETSAPYQFFTMTVFRAVENRRSIARSANTGISGFIDPVGRISNTTDLFKDATSTQTIPILETKTVYTRFGNIFIVISLILSFSYIGIQLLKVKRHKKK